MKKFQNRTHKLQQIEFRDGVTQFLFSGESLITSKSVVGFTDGIVESEVEKKTRKKKSSKSDSQEIDGSNEPKSGDE